MEEFFNENTSFDAKKEIVCSLGVYELRGLARVLGVKSPTTKKRDELISLILQIVESDDDLSVSNAVKRGRPYKAISSVQNILDVISAGNDEPFINSSKLDSYEELTVFNQDMPKITCQSSNIFPSSGVVRKGTSFGYFIDNACQRLVYIAPEHISKYKLESGDFIDCAVFEINNGVKCFVKKINKINGISAEEHNAEVFSDYDQVFPEAMEFEGKTIAFGGRNVLLKSSPLYMNFFIKNLLLKCKDKKVILGTNLCFEDKAFIIKERENFAFTSEYTDKMTDGYDRILDAISFTERLDQINESALLVVNDFANMLNVLDSYFINDEASAIFGHKEKTIVIAKKLISLAKAKSNNQNITIIILCDKQDTEDNFIKSELLKISNVLE